MKAQNSVASAALLVDAVSLSPLSTLRGRQPPAGGAQPPAATPQQPPGAPGAPAPGRGRGGGFRQPDPIDFQEHDGWTSLFDGQTLKGWSGDQNWKVEDGAITIESTCEKPTGTVREVPRAHRVARPLRVRKGHNPEWRIGMASDVTTSGRALAATVAAVIIAGALATATPQSSSAQPPAAGPPDDHTGYEAIFDGSTMKNWDGDPSLWKVANGFLVGESTAGQVKENTFLIWRGGEPADFELQVDFRMTSTNSGIQFRSVYLPQGTKVGNAEIAGKWVLKGYQADIDFANQYTGMIYEERGRTFLARRGQIAYIAPTGGQPKVIGTLEMTADELKGIIKVNDWNHVHLIARGTTIVNIVNGHVTAMVIDDDVKGRALKGLLGFQMHVGPPMKIEFRNIYLKTL